MYYNAKWDFWALSRYDDVAPATKDHETFSSAKGATLDMVKAHDDAIPVPKVIISMDPPEHQKMRKLVSNVFTPRAIACWRDMVREKVYERIEALDPASFDVVADFSALFPNEVITTMLGVPKQDRDQIRVWVDLLLERHPGEIAVHQAGIRGLGEHRPRTTTTWCNGGGPEPQDDMISRLIETEIERDGQVEKLTDVDVAGFATLLGGRGRRNGHQAGRQRDRRIRRLSRPVAQASRRPKQDPGRGGGAVALRGALAVSGPDRHTRRDVATGPRSRRAARYYWSRVRLHGTSACSTTPTGLDIDRDRKMGFNLAFGYGIHSCLGAALARMEGRIALDALLGPASRVRGRPRRTAAGGDGERLWLVKCSRAQGWLKPAV